MFTIQFVTVGSLGQHVLHSEACSAHQIEEACERADDRLARLQRNYPTAQIDGYRIMDSLGEEVLRSWETTTS